MGLLDMGTRSAVTQYVAKLNATQSRQELNGLCSTATVFYLMMGFFTVSAGFLLARFMPYFMSDIGPFRETVQTAVVIVSLEVAIILTLNVFGGIVIGLQRFDISQGISILVTLLRALGTVFVLLRGYGIVGLAAASLGSTLLGNVLQTLSAFRLLPDLRISPRLFNQADVRKLFGFGLAMFVTHISGKIIFYTDATVIGIFGSASQITHYVIAGNLIDYSAGLLSTISVVLFPMASDLNARKDTEGLRRALIMGTRLTLSVGVPIYISFLIIGKDFIELWMGEQYGQSSPIVLTILTVGSIARISQFNSVSILAGMQKHKFLSACMSAEAAANLVLSIVLVNFYGIYGVALGTTIPIIFMRIFFVARHVSIATGLDFARYLKDTALWALKNGAFFALPLLLITQNIPLDSWPKLAGSILASLAVYTAFLYLVGLNGEERVKVRQLLQISQPGGIR
jgi:O-antigen/teichoic acid export membrane protein